MAKASNILEWCIVRLGDDHNWWVDEVSDPIRWDVDGLSIVDPRQVAHLGEMVDTLRDYGFEPEIFEGGFIPFRIEKDLGNGRVRLKRVKDSLLESEERLFALPDVVDEENGPYADLLDHLTRCRVKMLNDLFDFDAKLAIDEVEDEIREEQNASFMEGKAVHCFNELCDILDFMPAGYDNDDDEERAPKSVEDEEDDIPDLDEEEEEALKNDSSLKWDEDEESEGEEGEKKEGEDADDDSEDEDGESDEDDDEDEKPRGKKPAAKSPAKPQPKPAAKAKPAKAATAKAKGRR